MTTIVGGCACGNVRYASTAAPTRMLNCHCRDCQRATGSAFAALCFFPSSEVALSGDLRRHTSLSEGGNTMERGFCPECGSPVAVKMPARPQVTLLYASSLDDPSIFQPAANIWTSSAQPWDHMDPSTPRFEAMPG